MKKLFISALFTLIFFGLGGTMSINASPFYGCMIYDNLNDTETKYNISYYYNTSGAWYGEKCKFIKIQSVNELALSTVDLTRYDEEFFENKFLVLLEYGTPGPGFGYDLRVTSVTQQKDSLNIELETVQNANGGFGTEEGCSWEIILEIDKEQKNKDISIHSKIDVLSDFKLQYYDKNFETDKQPLELKGKPSIIKIDSIEKLMECLGDEKESVLPNISETNFKNGEIVVIVNWIEDSSMRTYHISSAYADDQTIQLSLSKILSKDDGFAVNTPYCAIITVPNSRYADFDFNLSYQEPMVLSIKDTIVQNDNEVDIPVILSGNDGFAGAKIEIGFDNTKLIPISITAGDVVDGKGIVSNLQSGTDVTQFNNITVVLSDSENFSKQGTLFTIKFKIAGEINDNSTSVWFNSVNMTNQNLENKEPIVHDGVITVINYTVGDINNDGIIDIKDAVLLKQHLHQKMLSATQLRAADVNHDGTINELDSDKLEKYLAKWDGIDLYNR